MTTCCSDKCERRFECAKHCFNKVGAYPSQDYSTFGSGTVTSDIHTVNYWCGSLGNYKMYEPIEKNCSGCVYEDADGSTSDISNCVCCSRNVNFAKYDNYRRR